MEGFFLGISLALCFLVLLSLYRAAFGPTVLDRIISVSVIGTKTTVILLLIGFIYKRVDMFVDISLAYALLNFIATLAAAKFFHTRKSIIPGSKYYATTQSFPDLIGESRTNELDSLVKPENDISRTREVE
ncbi:MAG: monovalent cation/H+ antiporter complex subunit F [Thermodesulfovibrionales bacterium]|nr:monovalent cation/H+ antiporter complex subunit F [Thermodesulfovibrionales bacterium]